MIGIGILASALGLFLVIGTVLAEVRVAHGLIRAFDFPRLQFVLAAGLVAPVLLWSLPVPWGGTAAAAMAVVALVQAARILRFTPLWPRQSVWHKGPGRPGARVRFLVSNVRMSNRDPSRLIALVRRERPDILILLEPDAAWRQSIAPIAADFDHRIERLLDTGYGMLLWSRLPLSDSAVRDLLVRDVPSIRTRVTLPCGDPFRLHALHPEPPVPSQDSEGRDAEIGLTGIEAKADPLPVIVTGDLNDVAWSDTTRRFQRLSGLLDPRVGCGLFNTYHAQRPWLRWPLDHLFHDPRFRMVRMARLPDIGSDHFPMLFELELSPAPAQDAPIETATVDDHAEVQELVKSEAAKDRVAVGSDWERDIDSA